MAARSVCNCKRLRMFAQMPVHSACSMQSLNLRHEIKSVTLTSQDQFDWCMITFIMFMRWFSTPQNSYKPPLLCKLQTVGILRKMWCCLVHKWRQWRNVEGLAKKSPLSGKSRPSGAPLVQGSIWNNSWKMAEKSKSITRFKNNKFEMQILEGPKM